MGICISKPPKANPYSPRQCTETLEEPERAKHSESPANGLNGTAVNHSRKDDPDAVKKSPFFPLYSPSPARYFFAKKSPAPSSAAASANSTPRRLNRPFPPPSPAKHIKALLARRHGTLKTDNAAAIPEGEESDGGDAAELDKSFGFSKQFTSRYDVKDEVGRGHFGYTCSAVSKKGDLKGQQVAVKIIPKAKMTTAIAIEDVRREVKIIRALTGHQNLVQFYDAFEDHDNVYIVME
ncbi:CDPK-related kinase 5 [Sarracenia purpurea var. burkii]